MAVHSWISVIFEVYRLSFFGLFMAFKRNNDCLANFQVSIACPNLVFRWYLGIFIDFQFDLGHLLVILGELNFFLACSKENFGNT